MSMMDNGCCGTGRKKWWYGLGVMLLISVFLLGMDFMMNGRITWSVWPIAGVLFFGVGFTLLNTFGRE